MQLLTSLIDGVKEDALPNKDLNLLVRYLDKIYQRVINGFINKSEAINELLKLKADDVHKRVIVLYCEKLGIKTHLSFDDNSIIIVDDIRDGLPPIYNERQLKLSKNLDLDEYALSKNIKISKNHFIKKDLAKI